jgi:hypothetical protein
MTGFLGYISIDGRTVTYGDEEQWFADVLAADHCQYGSFDHTTGRWIHDRK